MDFDARAREIIAENVHLVMATSDIESHPWITPVYYAYDDRYNFYWTSDSDSRHSKNIEKNGSRIAFVIFDSSPQGSGEGVFFEGKAYELSDEIELEAATEIFYKRKNKPKRPNEDFLGSAPRRMYKAIFEHCWINAAQKIGGHIVDSKIEIKLV